jgi:hypothetical protein
VSRERLTFTLNPSESGIEEDVHSASTPAVVKTCNELHDGWQYICVTADYRYRCCSRTSCANRRPAARGSSSGSRLAVWARATDAISSAPWRSPVKLASPFDSADPAQRDLTAEPLEADGCLPRRKRFSGGADTIAVVEPLGNDNAWKFTRPLHGDDRGSFPEAFRGQR